MRSGSGGDAASSSTSNPSPSNSQRMETPPSRRSLGGFDLSQSVGVALASPKTATSNANCTPLRGHLWKQSPSFLKAFQRRYVVVEEGRISWHAPAKSNANAGQLPPAEGDAKGAIDLCTNNCEVIPDLQNPDRFTLQPINGRWARDANFTGASNGRMFHFDATGSEYSRAWWMAAIKRHIHLSHSGPTRSDSSLAFTASRVSAPATAFGCRPLTDADSRPVQSYSTQSFSGGSLASPPRRSGSGWRQSPPPLLPSQVRPNSEDPSFNYQRMDEDALPVPNRPRNIPVTQGQKQPPADADYDNTDHEEMSPSWQQDIGLWPTSVLGPVPGVMM